MCGSDIYFEIVEQSNEWVYFRKVFSSINRPVPWRILSNYGIPDKLLAII
jgi:hypothetical protein